MIHETIDLTEDGRVSVRTYVLDVYRRTKGVTRPAMIVCPGGGYGHISTSEGEPVALTFNQLGYNCFVLSYSVGDDSSCPNPLVELARTVAMVRERADEWQVDPSRVAVVGFSAGANLSAMLATQWHDPEVAALAGSTCEGIRPDACLVGYAPSDLTRMETDLPEEERMEKLGEGGEGRILTDGTPQVSYANFIDGRTVPMFLWHSRTDEIVPSVNALLAARAMDDAGVPYELHLIDAGHHGQSVDNRISHPLDDDCDPSIQAWVPLADHWVRRRFGMAL